MYSSKLKYLISFLFLGFFSKAQYTTHHLFHVGYAYQNQSFGEVGGKFLFLKNDDVLYRIGAGALMGKTNDKFAIMPKIQGDVLLNFQRNVDIWHSYYFLAGAEATTKYIAPKIGLNIFGVVDIAAGYAFPLAELNGKKLSGLNFNFTLNIPLVVIQDLIRK